MMDFHILIVISCVFLASLFSLLFINKFFRRKTFEEVIAEKKALTEKIYGKDKAALKKPKKQQLQLKKEFKREKKQRQRERQKDATEQEESEGHSDQHSEEDEPQGLSKVHVEFEPDPEVVTYSVTTDHNDRLLTNSDKESGSGQSKSAKSKKDKKGGAGKSGILVNKSEAVVTKETSTENMNHFTVKPPKDVVELKKLEEKKEKKVEKVVAQQQTKRDTKNTKKLDNRREAEKSVVTEQQQQQQQQSQQQQQQQSQQPQVVEAGTHVAKELKQVEEKPRQSSPKTAQQKSKQQTKKQAREAAETKELVVTLDKLSETDTIGVSLLMNLFRRAELNRSEIQLLIDYLLNKQQDMPSIHSEWSDDICQKLKRQLEEKEKALAEEQEASIGIQAKLRELRSEINTERVQMNATIKSYMEKIQTKEQDINILEQRIKTLNDNMTLERQQFQAKLMHEKQAGSQDLLAQLQLIQNELAHKDKCIAELTCIVNASRQAVEESQQKNEIIQTQAQQLRVLEQQRDELEQVSNNRIFELEQAKQLETELAEAKVELRNLQNALESAKADVAQGSKDLEAVRNELALARNVGFAEKQQEIEALQAKNTDLTHELVDITNKTEEQTKEQSRLQVQIDNLHRELTEKEKRINDIEAERAQLQQQLAKAEANTQEQAAQQQALQKLVDSLRMDVADKSKQLHNSEQHIQEEQERQKLIESLKSELANKQKQLEEQKEPSQGQQELQRQIDMLKADVASKTQQLEEVEKKREQFSVRENELLQQLQEQREKNNQQEKLLESMKPGSITASIEEEGKVRGLFERLYPEAVRACANTALTTSLDQWVEQVVATHLKQQQQVQQVSSSHKSTQSNSSNHHVSTSTSTSTSTGSHNSHNNLDGSAESTNNSSNSSNSGSGRAEGGSSADGSDNAEIVKLSKQNTHLLAQVDELTKLVTKTSNALADLEERAREQDENWRIIVRSKDEQINSLQHSNGQQDI